jgi:hypothetical protein
LGFTTSGGVTQANSVVIKQFTGCCPRVLFQDNQMQTDQAGALTYTQQIPEINFRMMEFLSRREVST